MGGAAMRLALLLGPARLICAQESEVVKQMPGCTPDGPDGCSMDPPPVKFHDKPLDSTDQTELRNPSGSGYPKTVRLFYNAVDRNLGFARSRAVRGGNLRMAQDDDNRRPYNPSSDMEEAPRGDILVRQRPAAEDCSGGSELEQAECALRNRQGSDQDSSAQPTMGVDEGSVGPDGDTDRSFGGNVISRAPSRSNVANAVVRNQDPEPPALIPPRGAELPVSNETSGDTGTTTSSAGTGTATAGADTATAGGSQALSAPRPPSPPRIETVAATDVFESTLNGLSAGGAASMALLRDDLASGEPPNNPYGIPNICFKLRDVVATTPHPDETFASDFGATATYCDFLRGLSSGFLDGFVSGMGAFSGAARTAAAVAERSRLKGRQDGAEARSKEFQESAAAKADAAHEAEMLTFVDTRRVGAAETKSTIGLLARNDDPTPAQLVAAKRRGDIHYASDRSRMKYEDFAADRWELRDREDLHGSWEVTVQNGRQRHTYSGAKPPFRAGMTNEARFDLQPVQMEGIGLFRNQLGKQGSRYFGHEPDSVANTEGGEETPTY